MIARNVLKVALIAQRMNACIANQAIMTKMANAHHAIKNAELAHQQLHAMHALQVFISVENHAYLALKAV